MFITIIFINTLMHQKFILASSSKSRYKILKNAGLNFTQKKPNCNEEDIKKTINRKTKPEIFAKKLSYEKARSVSIKKLYANKIVLGCDTVIYHNGKILDKVNSIEKAQKKIKSLSGKTHLIVSGLTICLNGSKVWENYEKTYVKIRKLDNSEIETYLKKTGKQILSSVGCYQIESLGPNIIESIKGDYFNVMGLPLFNLLDYLYSKK